MHEVGLIADAIERAVQTARSSGAERIEGLTFQIAPHGHVTPEIVQTLFESLSGGTMAEGAHLNIEFMVETACCWKCGTVFADHLHDDRCPHCGSQNIAAALAPDVVLASIDVPDGSDEGPIHV